MATKPTSKDDQLSMFAETETAITPPLTKKSPKVTKDNFINVDINSLIISPDQPRNFINEELLTELSESIRQHGIIQPVVVKKGLDNQYILVAGQRRYRAARMVGLERIPAVLTVGDQLEIALIENLQRCDLSAIEESEALSRLKELRGCTLEQMSKIIGKSKATISEITSLTRLPDEIKDACREDSSVPRSILVDIARKATPEDMLKAFRAYREKGIGRKEIRNLKTTPSQTNKRIGTKVLTTFARRIEAFEVEKLKGKQREKVKSELQNLQEKISLIIDKLNG